MPPKSSGSSYKVSKSVRSHQILRESCSALHVCGESFRSRRNRRALITAVLSNGSPPSADDGNRATRLGRIIQKRQRQLVQKLNDVRRGLPTKIFLLLLGFYSANALATVLGQTGDWDVLAAGLMVAVIEGIGYVLYRKPPVGQTVLYVFKMINYWKAGFSFGLFVDAFKLGS